MSKKTIRPSTLDGISSLAKEIKRERNIAHHEALDVAARTAGFQNLRHAQSVLKTGFVPIRLFLSAYWRDRKSKEQNGRETLTILLSNPWEKLIRPNQLSGLQALNGFRGAGPDHLECQNSLGDQKQARHVVILAARTLQFMDVTGLRASRAHSRAYPKGNVLNSIPGQDHARVWYEPQTKRYVISDEPYEPSVERRLVERDEWAAKFNFQISKPDWPGMYNPYGSARLYLFSHATEGVPLGPLVERLNRSPRPLNDNEPWTGESAPSLPWFISPGYIERSEKHAEQSASVPKKRSETGRQSKTVSYVRTFVGPQRRPKTRMPISAHLEIGGLLKSVYNAMHNRKGVQNRVDSVRAELDEWVQREYTSTELPNEQFTEMYYGERQGSLERSITPQAKARHVESLARVKTLLPRSYPDCAPVRRLLSDLDKAISSLERWKD